MAATTSAAGGAPATMAATQAALSPIMTATGCLFSAGLLGRNEVPKPGATAGRGSATVSVDTAKGEVCFAITAEGITFPATGAHVRKGAAGVASWLS